MATENPLDSLSEEEQRVLADLARARLNGHVSRRDALKAAGAVGAGAVMGGGAALGMGGAAADASTSDSDGDIGQPGDRVDAFLDGADANSVDTGDLNSAKYPDTAADIKSKLEAGGNIVIPRPGTYTPSATISIASNTVLILREGVTIKSPGSDIINNSGVSDVQILGRGGVFDGDRGNTSGDTDIIDIQNGTRILVEGLRCTSGRRRAVNLDNCTDSVIRDVRSRDMIKGGCYAIYCTSTIIQGCIDVDAAGTTNSGTIQAYHGHSIEGSDGCAIVGCVVENVPAAEDANPPFGINAGATNCVVANNTIVDIGGNSTDGSNPRGVGIHMLGGDRSVVVGNYIDNAAGRGIRLIDGSHIGVVGNSIHDGGARDGGVVVQATNQPVEGVLIGQNVFFTTSGATFTTDIAVGGFSSNGNDLDGLIVSGNQAAGLARDFIRLNVISGAGVFNEYYISGNYVTDHGRFVVNQQSGAGAGGAVNGNVANGDDGFRLTNSDLSVSANSIDLTDGGSWAINTGGARAVVTGNRATGTASASTDLYIISGNDSVVVGNFAQGGNSSFTVNGDDTLVALNQAISADSWSFVVEGSGVWIAFNNSQSPNFGNDVRLDGISGVIIVFNDFSKGDVRTDNGATFTAKFNENHEITENGGETTVDNGGTIAHGLVEAPTVYNVECRDAGQVAQVTSVDATNLTVEVLTVSDGSGAGTGNNVSWEAKVR